MQLECLMLQDHHPCDMDEALFEMYTSHKEEHRTHVPFLKITSPMRESGVVHWSSERCSLWEKKSIMNNPR